MSLKKYVSNDAENLYDFVQEAKVIKPNEIQVKFKRLYNVRRRMKCECGARARYSVMLIGHKKLHLYVCPECFGAVLIMSANYLNCIPRD